MGRCVRCERGSDVGVWAERSVDALAGAGVADVGKRRQAGAGCRIQGGQGVDAGGAQVVDGSGFDVGELQRSAVGGGYELDVPGEAPGFAGVPQIVALLCASGDAVAGDEGAVQYHVAHPLRAAAVQRFVQLGGRVGQDVNCLVEVAVAGGLRESRGAGQAVHAAGLTEPTQHEDGLPEGAQRTGALRGADPAAVAGQ